MAIARAVWANIKAGGIAQGGSTLTQQLVRSYFLTTDQTLSRKLREAVMAVALELHFTKADLMNAYINEIYLGQDGQRAVHGFGLASQFYFGKPLAELDLSEVALLVAVVRGPSYYDPRRHADRVRARRDLVLKVLAERKRGERGGCEGRRQAAARNRHAQLAAAITRRIWISSGARLRRDYREEDLTEAGLRIYTSLDPRAQDQAERTLEHELGRLDQVNVAAARKTRGKEDVPGRSKARWWSPRRRAEM